MTAQQHVLQSVAEHLSLIGVVLHAKETVEDQSVRAFLHVGVRALPPIEGSVEKLKLFRLLLTAIQKTHDLCLFALQIIGVADADPYPCDAKGLAVNKQRRGPLQSGQVSVVVNGGEAGIALQCGCDLFRMAGQYIPELVSLHQLLGFQIFFLRRAGKGYPHTLIYSAFL